jgi:uncharacterized protein YceH (UPF0502 family)
MEDCYEHGHELRALAMRVAALEDNVAFLEQWCEEQQDTLDRTAGPIGYDYEREPGPRKLRVVDLRDGGEAGDDDAEAGEVDTIVAVVETEHDHLVGQIQARLNRLRTRLALSVAPPAEPPAVPPAPRPSPRRLSAKQAGRTAP